MICFFGPFSLLNPLSRSCGQRRRRRRGGTRSNGRAPESACQLNHARYTWDAMMVEGAAMLRCCDAAMGWLRQRWASVAGGERAAAAAATATATATTSNRNLDVPCGQRNWQRQKRGRSRRCGLQYWRCSQRGGGCSLEVSFQCMTQCFSNRPLMERKAPSPRREQFTGHKKAGCGA